ncbi:amino acid adenylation domain-containing protein [Fulvivirgaceae bacterium BMA12]|uniref:Amino acid adenylation domain-containing protein n=1 Tax=Agaribacillus aureus TaxID=3051825 RepID=A0ABT8L7S9_9BACT|nr:amino acid adenylation domain-containing protein [Fulvivirgaceae bacterium BMA12]
MTSKNKSSQNKGSLLERWLTLNKSQETPGGVAPRPEGTISPLSSGQQKLWFLQQLYPQNPFYNYTEIYRFTGKLNTEILLKSFRQVIARHEILRTTIALKDGEAVQIVNDDVAVDVVNHDFRHIVVAQHEQEIQSLISKESSHSFDLTRGPLTRLNMVKLSEDNHLVMITMHHIITDEWSLGILQKEWAMIYQALQSGNNPTLQTLTIQYADYAYWQKKRPVDPKHLAYWKEKLQGKLPVLNLPSDRPRPAIPSFEGGFCTQSFPIALSGRIQELAKETNTTMFVFLLAVYKVLLYRYSGQEDILVGTPFNGRDQVSMEKLIGYFIDTLVLRSKLSGNTKFTDLLAAVRQTSLDAFSHKELPFETLVKELKPDRYMSANPLFQVMFVYHKVPTLPSFGPDVTFEQVPFEAVSAKFDLTLHVSEKDGVLTATFEYAKDLFERTTIERIQRHLKVLIEGIAENPETAIEDLRLLTQPEQHQLLDEWNETGVPFEDGLLIHQLFERQAIDNPNAPAVAFQGKQLTYQQLNEQSNAIAAYLHEKGVGKGSLVGLFAERSTEFPVGILGILKAGGAYLPLDPDYPAERISLMIADAGIDVILTHDRLTANFSNTTLSLLTFEEAETRPSTVPQGLPNDLSADNLAYVIYTSGSTGQPKGVPVTHGNLLRSTQARFEYYPTTPESFLLLSSFSFDSSVAGIFWTLSSGGLLVVSDKRIEQDISQLANLIQDHRITHTLLLPSLYNLLLQYAPEKSLTSLRTIIVAGEACPPSLCKLHAHTMEHATLYNEYGPTEATVWCTVHKTSAEDKEGPVSIGRPIANARIYILDQKLRPVPVGVPGELYVAGAGLTQGYLGKPEISNIKFLPNPFSADPTDKIYKTGDLARYRADGLIEFLGRADDQVKIRGFRIELDEIKETLKTLDGIQDAAVLVHKEQKSAPIEDINSVDVKELVDYMTVLDAEKASELLRSVEILSENELDYMLDEMKKSNKQNGI